MASTVGLLHVFIATMEPLPWQLLLDLQNTSACLKRCACSGLAGVLTRRQRAAVEGGAAARANSIK